MQTIVLLFPLHGFHPCVKKGIHADVDFATVYLRQTGRIHVGFAKSAGQHLASHMHLTN